MTSLFHSTAHGHRRQFRRSAKTRRCFVEPLEERRLLTSTPGLPWLEQFDFGTMGDFELGDHAGGRVAISGDTIVVNSTGDDDSGPDAGAAYVYIRNDAGTPGQLEDDTWDRQAKLTPDDGVALDKFSTWADIQGDTIVVSAQQNDYPAPGAAYVFQRTGTQWLQVAKLTASDGMNGDRFGVSVAIDGGTIVVGAQAADANGVDSGAAYVFDKPTSGWANQTETAKLTVNHGQADGFRFGRRVDVEGNRAVVTAPQTGVGSGVAYLFERNSNGDWGAAGTLQGSGAEFGAEFGSGAVLEGDRALITAFRDDHSGVIEAGAGYIFERQSSGNWIETDVLMANDASTNDWFGRAAAMDGDRIVMGARRGEIQVADSGSAYFFERQDDGSWLQVGEVTSSEAEPDRTFGNAVALQGAELVVGDFSHDSNTGGAYVITKGGSSILAADLFESGSFSNGLGQWSSGGWTVSGDASLRTDADPRSGLYHTLLRRSSGDLRRIVDVSGLSDIQLRFWSKLYSFEGSDQAHVSVSGDGSSWTTLTTFVNGQDDNEYHFFELDVPDVGDTLHIRFDAAMSGSRDYWYIDNVEVTGAPDGPPNRAPSITTSPVITATEDVTYSYDVDASDPDAGDTLTFSLDSAPDGMTIDAGTGVISWTPDNDDVGLATVTVRVQDDGGLSDTQGFDVTVANVNDAPIITSLPITIATAESGYAYDVEATDPDQGSSLTYSLDAFPGGMTINAVTGLIQWTPTSTQVGLHPVTVRVQDGAGGDTTQAFSIDVAAVNHPPEITSNPETTATEDLVYVYDVDASDTDPGDSLVFSLDDGPIGMTIDSASGLIEWTPSNAQVGSNGVTVRVVDQAGASDTQFFSVTVTNTNDAPTISSTPVATAVAGLAYSYEVQAADPDGDVLIFSLPTAPLGMSIDASTGTISWMPTSTQVGSHPVAVRVEDSGSLFGEQSFSITVSPAHSTKFYVVDASADEMFEYDPSGGLEDNYNLGSGNSSPKGAAADATGQTVWVIDNDDYVYVYDSNGNPQRSWKALGLSRPEGIASDGTDIWIVDRGNDRVHYFAGGATRTVDASATFSFSLVVGNPRGITTDGTHLWVVDTGTDDVYKYTTGGTFLGSWALDSRNSVPRGITIDPSNVDDIWVVDSTDDAVYQYSGAATRTSGSQAADVVFGLAGGNTNPQGIADPPPAQQTDSELPRSVSAGRVPSFVPRTAGDIVWRVNNTPTDREHDNNEVSISQFTHRAAVQPSTKSMRTETEVRSEATFDEALLSLLSSEVCEIDDLLIS